MTTSILVSGGAGFVGSRLATLLARGRPAGAVVALDNLRRRGSELNLRHLADAGVEFVHGDIRCLEDLDDQRLEAETLIDCSAEPSVLAGYEAPRQVVQNNLVGTANLLEHTRRVGARFVFLSTSRVFPIAPLAALPLDETDTRFELAANQRSDQTLPGISSHGVSEAFPLSGHRSLYGATKLSGELLIAEYAEAFGVSAVVNRCGVVAGPGQMARSDQGVFALWAAAHLLQRDLAYIGFGGHGRQVRDLLHVDDLADLVAIQLDRFDEVAGETFNVGGGPARALSLLETTALCETLTGHRLAMGADPATRPGDIPWFITDARRVQARLGWEPTRSAERTLEDIIAWIREDEANLARVLG